jgi:hypothetical protein
VFFSERVQNVKTNIVSGFVVFSTWVSKANDKEGHGAKIVNTPFGRGILPMVVWDSADASHVTPFGRVGLGVCFDVVSIKYARTSSDLVRHEPNSIEMGALLSHNLAVVRHRWKTRCP